MPDDTLTPHPIQAIHIAPRELRLRAHTPPDLDFEYDETEYNLEVGHSDYFADKKKNTDLYPCTNGYGRTRIRRRR